MSNVLNLNNDNVFERDMTLEEARKFIDSDLESDQMVTDWFDEVQGYVMQHGGKAYLVIEISQ